MGKRKSSTPNPAATSTVQTPPPVDQTAADRVAAEKAEADRVAAEKTEADRLTAEKAEADRVAAEKAEADRIAAEKAEADLIAGGDEQAEGPTDEDLAELGLVIEADGLVTLELLVGISGVDFAHGPKDKYRCSPAEAFRFVTRNMAVPGHSAA